jgi:DNA modification methylase
MVGEELVDHHPNVEAVFVKWVEGSIERMKEFYRLCPRNVSAKIFQEDSRQAPIQENSIDLIVTSPPYGEESHTMSYNRFAKLSLLWMRMSIGEINRAASRSLGGTERVFRKTTPLLDNTYAAVASVNKERAGEMFSFMWDYKIVLKRLARLLRLGGQCCIVIGDRTVAGVPIPNGELTLELARDAGLEFVTQSEREIPKKVLPRRDYKVELINREHIIVLEKTRDLD